MGDKRINFVDSGATLSRRCTMDEKTKLHDKYPTQTRDEEVSYKVYYYSSSMPKPGWIGTQTFDNLNDAKEYAEYRLKSERRVEKTIVMKFVQTTKSVCIMDTLKTKGEKSDE